MSPKYLHYKGSDTEEVSITWDVGLVQEKKIYA